MNPKLRIMTIRLMKKMVEHPGYAAWIGEHDQEPARSK